MLLKRLSLLVSLGFFFVAFSASDAHAKRGGLILITHGETIKHVQDLSQEAQNLARQTLVAKGKIAIGYRYSAFGIFWLDIWAWGGEYCLYDNANDYWDLDDEVISASKIDTSNLAKPWTYTFPPGLIVLVVLVGSYVVYSMKSNNEQKELTSQITKIAEDTRYKHALEIFSEYHESKASEAEASGESSDDQDSEEEDQGYESAIKHLTEQGIEREEAEKNFGLLLHAVAASNE